jgi:hypothetical protein
VGTALTKYHNKPTTTIHGRFDSRGEAARYAELVLLERAGEITDLRRQVALYLHGRDGVVTYPSGRVAKVVVDYAYKENGVQVYSDYKGCQTPLSKLQHAILRAQGVEVLIVR